MVRDDGGAGTARHDRLAADAAPDGAPHDGPPADAPPRAAPHDHPAAEAPPRDRLAADAGQATVELVAVLPLVAALLAAVWQLALIGYAQWAANVAARAAARADAVGADPATAARAHLSHSLERGLGVQSLSGGAVRVAIRIPTLPGLPSIGHARATGHFEPQS